MDGGVKGGYGGVKKTKKRDDERREKGSEENEGKRMGKIDTPTHKHTLN